MIQNLIPPSPFSMMEKGEKIKNSHVDAINRVRLNPLSTLERGFRGEVLVSIIILLIGWLFIIHAGVQNKRFHPDEALYTTFARNAVVHGDWLLTSPLDKPPISIYANALSQMFFGVVITDKGVYDLPIRIGEFVARIPNMFAGMITLALFIALERKLIPRKPPLGAYLFAIAPFFYAFSASAFTDMLLLMWVMGAWLSIERGQSGLSGFLLAMGFATKPQAIFFLPLIIIRGLWGKPIVQWRRFALYGLLVIAILLIWDISRGATSVFLLGSYNYPDLFVTSGDVISGNIYAGYPQELLMLLVCCIGFNPLTVVFFGGWILFTKNQWAVTIGIFLTIYFVLHMLIGFQLYDRYFLPLIPIFTLLIANGLWNAINHNTTNKLFAILLFFISLLIISGLSLISIDASIGRDGYPVDSEGGIITLAEEINNLPFAAVVYDHWRGWELGYYLGAWSEKRRVYYPNPSIQASDSLNNPEMWTRYLVAPINEPYEVWLDAMRDVGYTVSVYKQIPQYIIFALDPPQR